MSTSHVRARPCTLHAARRAPGDSPQWSGNGGARWTSPRSRAQQLTRCFLGRAPEDCLGTEWCARRTRAHSTASDTRNPPPPPPVSTRSASTSCIFLCRPKKSQKVRKLGGRGLGRNIFKGCFLSVGKWTSVLPFEGSLEMILKLVEPRMEPADHCATGGSTARLSQTGVFVLYRFQDVIGSK